MSYASSGQSGWRRLRSNPATVITIVVIAALVGVAIDRGVASGKLSLAVVILIAVAIPSIMFHEVSHGIVAYWCGDDTAKRAGRLSANPARHVDPIGTVIVPIVLVLLHGPAFGWARPVPVSVNRLRRPRNHAVLVALAGPASNALLAIVAGVIVHFIMATSQITEVGIYVSVGSLSIERYGASGGLYWLGVVVGFLGLVNIFIGAFNLIPIPPLDGSAVLERFIPVEVLPTYYRMRMAFMVVVLLLVLFDRGLLDTLYYHLTVWYLGLFSPHIGLLFG